MPERIEIRITPQDLGNDKLHFELVAAKLKVDLPEIRQLVLMRRSLDARHGRAEYLLRFEVYRRGESPVHRPESAELKLQKVDRAPEVIIVGCGPAGLYAAIRLIEHGLRPIVIERGKAVRDRRRDIANLTKLGIVDPDSNYCFGEGGAGTFSDGKLYTRSNKRGSIERVLNVLVRHGASPDIQVDAHPHIGTNLLPGVVQAMRETIVDCGGQVLFGRRLTRIEQDCGNFIAAQTNCGERFSGKALILATGHSARDVFEIVHAAGLTLEQKPFAVGVRVEHPQQLIDEIQYGCSSRRQLLPPASYTLRAQARERGVFSFCMCPGGIICPAATAPGEVVVNGWSPSKRNSRFANSGIVVEINSSDLPASGLFSGVDLQRTIEQAAFSAGGSSQAAPASRLTDYLAGKVSTTLPDCSYLPGAVSADLRQILPPSISTRLAEGFKEFGRKMKSYLTEEAIILAPESRTSSPIRIPRSPETFMHPELNGLFPCGEGAGYAGGIVSAAMDGTAAADCVERYLHRG